MWLDFGEFIANLCKKDHVKIAEIGVGKYSGVYDYLNSQENIEIIKTDILPASSDVIFDDITKPNLDLYKDKDIIYSIRPPSELQPHIANLYKQINARLIIKPLFNEDLNIKSIPMQLKNYKKASFYIDYEK